MLKSIVHSGAASTGDQGALTLEYPTSHQWRCFPSTRTLPLFYQFLCRRNIWAQLCRVLNPWAAKKEAFISLNLGKIAAVPRGENAFLPYLSTLLLPRKAPCSLYHTHPAPLRSSAYVWGEGIFPGSLHVALVLKRPQMLPTREGVVPSYPRHQNVWLQLWKCHLIHNTHMAWLSLLCCRTLSNKVRGITVV